MKRSTQHEMVAKTWLDAAARWFIVGEKPDEAYCRLQAEGEMEMAKWWKGHGK